MAVAFAMVLCSGALHATWNLFTKKSRNKNAFLWHCQWVSIAIFLPWVIHDAARIEWGMAAIVLLALSMLIHALYTVLLAKAYTIGDLSQVYPIMRGTSPLLVPIAGVLFLGESLSFWSWCGIGIIVTGIVFLSEFRPGLGKGASLTAVFYAITVGICISGYIIIDKMALEYVPLFALNAATNLGNLFALTFMAVKSGQLRSEWKLNKGTIALVGFIAPGGYILFLLALTFAPVAALAPMREIGTAFGALLGVWLLKESRGSSRIPAAVCITVGVIVTGVFYQF